MNTPMMNQGLQALRTKYAVACDGKIDGNYLHLTDGRKIRLLPWRVERRFVELQKLVTGKTLEDVSTLRFAAMSAAKSLDELLYRELDLCAFLGGSAIVSTFAVFGGCKIANVLVKLADGKSCSVECSAALPIGTDEIDRHEIIARRGIACDRTVDTQVPQSSIYLFTAGKEARFTDTDAELFGLSNDEITLVRAAFQVLKNPALIEEWSAIDAQLQHLVEATVKTDKTHQCACFAEVK